MSKDKAPRIMDLVTYGKFKTTCDCNGGPYEYINCINYEAAQSAYLELEAKLAECVAALEAADFVLQGSRAIPGQSDKTLDKREGALWFFLDTLAKVKK
jgi:hypothetical protein